MAFLCQHRPDMYIPAQHGTKWQGLLSRLQAEAHHLAVLGLQGPVRKPTHSLGR